MITLVEKYQDLSGRWVVRLTNGTESLFLNFNHDPSTQEIQYEGQKAIDQILAERQERKNDNDTKITLLDAVIAYDKYTWSNVQKQNLLDALVARIRKKLEL